MVPIKPYVAIVFPVAQTATPSGIAGNPSIVNIPQEVYVYFERISPGEAYQKYGVELRDPAFIQCEVFDGGKFGPDAEVIVAGRVYRVVGMPEHHDAGNEADHTDVALEFKQYPITQ